MDPDFEIKKEIQILELRLNQFYQYNNKMKIIDLNKYNKITLKKW